MMLMMMKNMMMMMMMMLMLWTLLMMLLMPTSIFLWNTGPPMYSFQSRETRRQPSWSWKTKKIQNLKGDLYLCFGQKMDLEVLKSYATKAILQTRKLLLIDTHTSTALHNRLCSEILLKIDKIFEKLWRFVSRLLYFHCHSQKYIGWHCLSTNYYPFKQALNQ